MLDKLKKIDVALKEALKEVEAGHLLTLEEVHQLEELKKGLNKLRDDMIRHSSMSGKEAAHAFGLTEGRISQIRNPDSREKE